MHQGRFQYTSDVLQLIFLVPLGFGLLAAYFPRFRLPLGLGVVVAIAVDVVASFESTSLTVASLILAAGLISLPLSAKAARLGLRFTLDGTVVPGRIVDFERDYETVLDSEGTETIKESSSPIVAYRTRDGREMRQPTIGAVVRTIGTRRNGEFVASSQRGQWQGRRVLGEIVRVRYLPDEPERFRIEGRRGSYLLWFLPLWLSNLCTVIGSVGLVVQLF